MNTLQYLKIQELISAARSREDLRKVANLLKVLPDSEDKDDLVAAFADCWGRF